MTRPQDRTPVKIPRVGPAQYLREVRSEMNKVTWPTRDELVKYTAIVIGTVIVLSLFIAALDFLFGEAITMLLDQANT